MLTIKGCVASICKWLILYGLIYSIRMKNATEACLICKECLYSARKKIDIEEICYTLYKYSCCKVKFVHRMCHLRTVLKTNWEDDPLETQLYDLNWYVHKKSASLCRRHGCCENTGRSKKRSMIDVLNHLDLEIADYDNRVLYSLYLDYHRSPADIACAIFMCKKKYLPLNYYSLGRYENYSLLCLKQNLSTHSKIFTSSASHEDLILMRSDINSIVSSLNVNTTSLYLREINHDPLTMESLKKLFEKHTTK